MGFMDKAKKLAEQAQAKLDEAQQQFNTSQGNPGTSGSSGPAVEYDKHGRPVPSTPPPDAATPPHGDPLGAAHEQAPPPPPAAPTPDPAAPPPAPPQAAPPRRPARSRPRIPTAPPTSRPSSRAETPSRAERVCPPTIVRN